MSVPMTAQITRRCCNWKAGVATVDTRLAYWELYVTAATWPAHQWPVSQRHTIPTPTERVQALASLGYQPAPGARWEWQETQTPAYHGHPSTVSMLGTISIVPLDQDGAS